MVLNLFGHVHLIRSLIYYKNIYLHKQGKDD